ncbi:hypothetical protein DFJ73DRAFT_637880, partial [Zopfochytrium polystomum]
MPPWTFPSSLSASLDLDPSVRLISFKALNQTFEIVLREKTDLIVPNGLRIEIDGEPASHELTRSLYGRSYEGTLLSPGDGWARLLFHSSPFQSGSWQLDQAEDLTFEGVISLQDTIYHIQTTDNYARSGRFGFDTELASPLSRPASAQSSTMIIYADNDETFMRLAEPPSAEADTCPSGASSCGSGRRRSRRATATPVGRNCGFDISTGHNAIMASRIDRSDLRNSNSLRRRDAGCTGTKQYLFMGAAADCAYVSNYGGSEGALKKILADFSTASATYESSFNVGLALIKVQIQTSCSSSSDTLMSWNQACAANYTINNRLSDFSRWRGNKADSSTDNAGLWHLLTGCTSTVSGTAVGIAWLQTTCMTSASSQSTSGSTEYVSGTGVSSIVPTEWKVVAHEIGHNFGAIHDCTADTCASKSTSCCACSPCDCNGQYLMHPTDNAATGNFSTCSIHDICQSLSSSDRNSCLKPPGALKTITDNICGNGVKEGTEECDCGDSTSCASDPCCDGTTCKLKNGAVCDDNNDDCCSSCQLKNQGVICRQSLGSCDYAETCTGKNATCPDDVHHPDGEACGAAGMGLTCASGMCTSRTQQCTGTSSGYNTTGVCAGRDADCQLLCSDTRGNCLQLAGNFIDGTSCGYAGQCRGGSCVEGSWIGSFIDWFKSNPQTSIPIVVGVGVLLILILLSCIQCCKNRYGREARLRKRPDHLPVIGSMGPVMVAVGPSASPGTAAAAAGSRSGSRTGGSR